MAAGSRAATYEYLRTRNTSIIGIQIKIECGFCRLIHFNNPYTFSSTVENPWELILISKPQPLSAE